MGEGTNGPPKSRGGSVGGLGGGSVEVGGAVSPGESGSPPFVGPGLGTAYTTTKRERVRN